MNEREVITIRHFDGDFWVCNRGFVYRKNIEGVLYPVLTGRKKNWFQKLFNL